MELNTHCVIRGFRCATDSASDRGSITQHCPIRTSDSGTRASKRLGGWTPRTLDPTGLRRHAYQGPPKGHQGGPAPDGLTLTLPQMRVR